MAGQNSVQFHVKSEYFTFFLLLKKKKAHKEISRWIRLQCPGFSELSLYVYQAKPEVTMCIVYVHVLEHSKFQLNLQKKFDQCQMLIRFLLTLIANQPQILLLGSIKCDQQRKKILLDDLHKCIFGAVQVKDFVLICLLICLITFQMCLCYQEKQLTTQCQTVKFLKIFWNCLNNRKYKVWSSHRLQQIVQVLMCIIFTIKFYS